MNRTLRVANLHSSLSPARSERWGSIALLLLAIALGLPATASAQWRKLSGFTSFYNEAFFLDNNTGWITGQDTTVLRTTDGGASWSTSNLPGGNGLANRD